MSLHGASQTMAVCWLSPVFFAHDYQRKRITATTAVQWQLRVAVLVPDDPSVSFLGASRAMTACCDPYLRARRSANTNRSHNSPVTAAVAALCPLRRWGHTTWHYTKVALGVGKGLQLDNHGEASVGTCRAAAATEAEGYTGQRWIATAIELNRHDTYGSAMSSSFVFLHPTEDKQKIVTVGHFSTALSIKTYPSPNPSPFRTATNYPSLIPSKFFFQTSVDPMLKTSRTCRSTAGEAAAGIDV